MFGLIYSGTIILNNFADQLSLNSSFASFKTNNKALNYIYALIFNANELLTDF
jgi:hypothetical protein